MSTIPLQCPVCSSGIQVESALAGQLMPCPACHQTIQIPQVQSAIPGDRASGPPPPDESLALTAACASCNQKFGVTAEMAGQQVACPFCHQVMQIPGGDAPVAETDSAPPAKLDDDEVKEAELYAPGFEPPELLEDMAANRQTDADNASDQDRGNADYPEPGPIVTTTGEVVDAQPVDSETDHRQSSEPQVGHFTELEHPLLPPTFESESSEEISGLPVVGPHQIVLPTAAGGVQTLDKGVVGVQTPSGRVLIESLPKERKELRRRIRSWVVYAFCAVVLIVVFILLTRLSR